MVSFPVLVAGGSVEHRPSRTPAISASRGGGAAVSSRRLVENHVLNPSCSNMSIRPLYVARAFWISDLALSLRFICSASSCPFGLIFTHVFLKIPTIFSSSISGLFSKSSN